MVRLIKPVAESRAGRQSVVWRAPNGKTYDAIVVEDHEPIQVPTGLTVHASTGRSPYSYRVVALDATGGTLASEPVGAKGSPKLSPTDANRLTWDEVDGASGYEVYGRKAGAEVYLATVHEPVYVDDGSDQPGEQQWEPPSEATVTATKTLWIPIYKWSVRVGKSQHRTAGHIGLGTWDN